MNEATEIHEIALAERKEKRNTLYEIEAELQALEDLGEEITEEHWGAFTVALAEQFPKNVSKRERVGQWILHLETQRDNRKAAAARFLEGAKFYDRFAARSRASVAYVMKAIGLKKLEGHTLSLNLRNNPVKVAVHDEFAVPPHYKRFHLQVWGDTWAEILEALPAPLRQRVVEEINERKIDTEVSKTRIKKDIEEGLDVAGADLEETQSVVIR